MNEDALLTLHCPQCKQLVEVITDSGSLVCLECGWKFDEKVAAKYLVIANQPLAPTEQGRTLR